MKKIFSLLLLSLFTMVFAQEQPEMPSDGKYKPFEINFKDASADGHWLAVYKIYDNQSDSLVIVNRHHPKIFYEKIKVLDYKWAPQDLVLRYDNRTEIFDYTKGTSFHLPVCESFVLNKKENLLILYGSEQVKVYNLKTRTLMDSISSVKKVFCREDTVLLLIQKNNTYELVKLKRNLKSILYQTKDFISNVTELQNQSLLIFKNTKNGIKDIVYYNDLQNKVFNFSEQHEVDFNFAKGYQRNDGSIVLTLEKPKKKQTLSEPEIWQASENNYKEKFSNTSTSQLLWIPEQSKVIDLGFQKMDRVVDTNNKDYFLSFSFSGMRDYTSLDVSLKLYRYDFIADTYDYIDVVKSGATYSPDGDYIIYKKDDYWKLVNVNSLKSIRIDNHGFSQAYFTENKKIFFDGSEGLWEYDLKRDRLKLNFNQEKGNYKILNSNYSTHFSSNLFELAFLCRTVDENNLLFEINNRADLITSIYEKSEKRYHHLLKNSTSKLVYKQIKAEKDYFFSEENFNLPNQVICLSRSKDKKVIYQSNSKDKAQFKIRIETVTFENSDHAKLRGILYYPLNYNPEKKYPMVVHVYQLQSHKRNVYPLSLERQVNVGFDLRGLLEKGYFVYLPDIINNEKGVGLSALYCVDKSLDALQQHKSINFQKVALIGHSFGGYVTNFISTHSNRFTTYISGASVSDIVKSYFSMSFHYMSPLYWQYEEGQFNFNAPYISNQELYFKNNPISYVQNVNKPMLLWAGKKDLNVEWGQSMEFYLGLKRNFKPATMIVYPEEGHYLASRESAKDLLRKVSEWLDYYLKDFSKPDWIE
ncbi:alpha/beta hydrolase family protein [Chryseobacterium sp. RLHN22]|uniref:alpha/beta hydrolase family protein n=1 Tax=Chryseobacterium sp. RLHN22 TaxID=3437885 RepID=UPI003D9AF8C7